MTAIRYPCLSVKIRLRQDNVNGLVVECIDKTHFKNVLFPAPRKPVISVQGTLFVSPSSLLLVECNGHLGARATVTN